jgi:hypothetical protein
MGLPLYSYDLLSLLQTAHNLASVPSKYVPFGAQVNGALNLGANQLNKYRKQEFLEKKSTEHLKGYGGKKFEFEEVIEASLYSNLGTPILMHVTFGKASWSEFVNGEKVTKSFEGITLAAATVVDFSQAKIIEKTHIASKNGSVKEYIGLDDWSIRIRGIIVNEDADAMPEQAIKELKKLKDCPVALPILNTMCDWLDIKNVVVEDVEFTALEGSNNMQPFTITCSSDEVFELKYKEGI